MQEQADSVHALRFVTSVPALREVPAVLPLGARPLCSTCHLRELCLPHGLNEGAVRALDELPIVRRRVKSGRHLFLQGDPLRFLYVVRAGCVKTSMGLLDGREQVTAFAFPGDMLGFDALATESHAASAVALEDSELCAIPYDALLSLPGDAIGGVRRRLHQKLGGEMTRDHHLATLLANTHSEPRVAAFLLMLSQHFRERGYSPSEFFLRMSRAEIGSYLGLTLETVSRTLSAFARRGWLDVSKRRLRIVKPDELARLCESALPGISRDFAHWSADGNTRPALGSKVVGRIGNQLCAGA